VCSTYRLSPTATITSSPPPTSAASGGAGRGTPLWARPSRTRGIIVAADTAVALDIVWIPLVRVALILGDDGKFCGTPDLLVEILSPDRSA
jgi:hypothetical protein